MYGMGLMYAACRDTYISGVRWIRGVVDDTWARIDYEERPAPTSRRVTLLRLIEAVSVRDKLRYRTVDDDEEARPSSKSQHASSVDEMLRRFVWRAD